MYGSQRCMGKRICKNTVHLVSPLLPARRRPAAAPAPPFRPRNRPAVPARRPPCQSPSPPGGTPCPHQPFSAEQPSNGVFCERANSAPSHAPPLFKITYTTPRDPVPRAQSCRSIAWLAPKIARGDRYTASPQLRPEGRCMTQMRMGCHGTYCTLQVHRARAKKSTIPTFRIQPTAPHLRV